MKTQINYKVLMFVFVVFLCSCQQNINNQHNYSTKDENNNKSKYELIFSEYGFRIESSCKLEDLSKISKTDFLLNYGGVVDEKDKDKIAFYQLMVVKLPVGYKDIRPDVLENRILDTIKNLMPNSSDSKFVKFGYEEFPGYVGYSNSNGYKQKAVMFTNKNYIFCLTVISNYNLETRFNEFTNEIHFIKSDSQNKDQDIQKIETLNICLRVPCKLLQSKMTGYDLYYSGAINSDNKNKAIVYKIMVNYLPKKYSEMIASDKETIKKNLLDYISAKESTNKKENIKIKNYMAYVMKSHEQGFNIKEGLILTENYVLELIVFSKLEVDADFENYINSLENINE